MTAGQAEKVSNKPAPSEPDTVPESSNGTLSEVALKTPEIAKAVGVGAGAPSAGVAAGVAVA